MPYTTEPRRGLPACMCVFQHGGAAFIIFSSRILRVISCKPLTQEPNWFLFSFLFFSFRSFSLLSFPFLSFSFLSFLFFSLLLFSFPLSPFSSCLSFLLPFARISYDEEVRVLRSVSLSVFRLLFLFFFFSFFFLGTLTF